MRIKIAFVAALAAAGMLFTPAVAVAGTPSPPGGFAAICNGLNFGAPIPGTAVSGNYRNLAIRGNQYLPNDATLTVSGNLTVAPGACLDAFSRGTVRVAGNVVVLPGATLALGCEPFVNEAVEPCEQTVTHDTVGRNITALAPLSMYLTALTVRGNVVSFGGGPGVQNPFISYPVKDSIIGGNLVLDGWQGAWIGALRNHVGGNIIVTNNTGSRIGESGTPDSTEVDSNTVGRNLICVNNTPAAQLGDAVGVPGSGNGPNTVAGQAIGECRGLTTG